MKKLNLKKRLPLIFILAAIVINVLLFIFIKKEAVRLDSTRSDLAKLEKEQQRISELERKYSELSDQILEIEKTLPESNSEIAAVLASIESAATASGVKTIFSLKDEQAKSAVAGTKSLAGTISLDGSYISIFNFLTTIYKQAYFFSPVSFNITQDAAGLKSTLSLVLFIK